MQEQKPISTIPILLPEIPLRPRLGQDPEIPFIECQNWRRGLVRKNIDLIVVHCMEGPEEMDRAERCAAWMAGKNPRFPAPKASAHYFVDSNSVVQGVPDAGIAWHAPGANNNGIGIEHAGKARQSREDWLDEFSLPMLDISAQLVGEILCPSWNFPVRFVDAQALLEKPQQRGITTHAEVTKAFKRSTHTDPGKGFPMDWYVNRVKAYNDRYREDLLKDLNAMSHCV